MNLNRHIGLLLGLHKLEWNPAILDGQTWSEFGEERWQDGKNQPVDLKDSIYQTDDLKRSILLHSLRQLIKS